MNLVFLRKLKGEKMSKIVWITLMMGVVSLFANPSSEEILGQALKRYESNRAFEMKFQVLSLNEMTGDKSQNSGFLKTGNAGEFLLRTPQVEFYSDNKTFWDYRPISKQVVVKNFADVQMKMGPSQVLLKYLGCQARSMMLEKVGKKSVWKMDLIPNKGLQQYSELRVWLDPQTFEPIQMETLDYSENLTQYKIESFKILRTSVPTDFIFPSPQGVEIIDMR